MCGEFNRIQRLFGGLFQLFKNVSQKKKCKSPAKRGKNGNLASETTTVKMNTGKYHEAIFISLSEKEILYPKVLY